MKNRLASPVFYKALYNKVLETFVSQQGYNCNKAIVKQIIDYLIERKIEFTYQNQLEALAQIYHMKDSDQFVQLILLMDYTLDPNVFNLMLNLILDQLDFETASKMFSLVFENKLSKINITTVDVSKSSLKCLLKIQMNKLKSVDTKWDKLELEDSEKSEMMSVLSSPRSKMHL